MDEKKSYNLDKQFNQNQPYNNTNAQFSQNQTYQAGGQNTQFDQNQPYGQPSQPYPQQNYTQPPRAVVYDTMPMKNNNVAIAGLVIGIFSILGCWVPFWDLILSIAGIICSAIGLSHKEQATGMAIGGLITSIIGLLLSILVCFIYFILVIS